MLYRDFMWKGQLASELGVIVTDQVAYQRPEERGEPVTIPGRSGTLRLLSERSWEEVVYSPGCALKPGADPEAVWEWLQGRGRVIFGSMPDFAFDARIDGAFSCSELIAEHPGGYLLFTPGFVCQPWRYEAIQTVAFDAGPVQRWNPGTMLAEPLIRVKGTAGASLEVQCSTGDALRVTVPDDMGGKEILIDMAWGSVACEGKRVPSSGEFFRLPVGFYTVDARAYSGKLLSATVEPRYRWL